MKKAIIILVLSLTIISCGESTETKPVKATQDSVGSSASPAPTESSKTEVNEELVEPEQDIK